MSKYTTQVRWICESIASQHNVDPSETSVSNVIATAAPSIFNFDYPIYDEQYRLPLEVKILRHFYTREIGEETVALWKLRLEDRLNIIMPYYNQLYRTALYEFNPLYDVDYTKTGHRRGNEEKSNTETENISANTSHSRGETKTVDLTDSEREDGSKENALNRTSDTTTTENQTANRSNNSNRVGNSSSTEDSSGSRSSESSGTSNRTESNENDSSGTSHNVNLYSDTPQGSLEIFGIEEPGTPTVSGNSWLTNATIDDGTTTGHSQGGSTSATTESGEVTETNSASHSGSETSNEQIQGNESYNSGKTGGKESSETAEGSETFNTNKVREQGGSTELSAESSGTEARNRTQNGNGTVVSMDDYVETVRGKMSPISYAKLILEFRQTILNIDKMIIEELNDLFFGLWN